MKSRLTDALLETAEKSSLLSPGTTKCPFCASYHQGLCEDICPYEVAKEETNFITWLDVVLPWAVLLTVIAVASSFWGLRNVPG